MLRYGTVVRSLRDTNLRGRIVGYATIMWPHNGDVSGDDNPEPAYLVKVRFGSSSLGRVCVVMRADQVEEASEKSESALCAQVETRIACDHPSIRVTGRNRGTCFLCERDVVWVHDGRWVTANPG